jgi:hypothetical protein
MSTSCFAQSFSDSYLGRYSGAFSGVFAGAYTLTGTPACNLPASGPQSLHHLIAGMARWLVLGSSSGVRPMERTSLRQLPGTRNYQSTHFPQGIRNRLGPQTDCAPARAKVQAAVAGAVSQNRSTVLRVLQVQEPDQPRSCVGRMVISGRMADVCAELDRLAARDAAPH